MKIAYMNFEENMELLSLVRLFLPIVEFSTTRLRRGCFLNNSASTCVGSHAR